MVWCGHRKELWFQVSGENSKKYIARNPVNGIIRGVYLTTISTIRTQIYPPLSLARYLSIQLSELEQCGVNEPAQCSKRQKRTRTPLPGLRARCAEYYETTLSHWKFSGMSPEVSGEPMLGSATIDVSWAGLRETRYSCTAMATARGHDRVEMTTLSVTDQLMLHGMQT